MAKAVNPAAWMNRVRGILGKYTDREPERPDAQPGSQTLADVSAVARDFEAVAEAAPHSALVDGLVRAFRSQDTPPFSHNVAHLFAQSNARQRADVLNILLSIRPATASDGMLALLAGNKEATPEQANSVPPETVQRIAAEAEQKDPSIVERLSRYYAEHPSLVKNLGIGTLALVIGNIGEPLRHRSGGAR